MAKRDNKGRFVSEGQPAVFVDGIMVPASVKFLYSYMDALHAEYPEVLDEAGKLSYEDYLKLTGKKIEAEPEEEGEEEGWGDVDIPEPLQELLEVLDAHGVSGVIIQVKKKPGFSEDSGCKKERKGKKPTFYESLMRAKERMDNQESEECFNNNKKCKSSCKKNK